MSYKIPLSTAVSVGHHRPKRPSFSSRLLIIYPQFHFPSVAGIGDVCRAIISAVRNWHANKVIDLNHAGYGGVPALFQTFTEEAGLSYSVSLETQSGKSLAFHYAQRRQLIDRAWDVVVLQEHSELDSKRPGDPTNYYRDVARLAALLRARNPKVEIRLMSTWTRADLTYKPAGHWYGKPVTAMADDLRSAADTARSKTPAVAGILPVGQAWSRAFAIGVADPNPYDGVDYGQLDLWTYDHYHASVAGYYREALIVFGGVTGRDPTTLGPQEKAADELGLSADQASVLQQVAHDQLSARRPLCSAGSRIRPIAVIRRCCDP